MKRALLTLSRSDAMIFLEYILKSIFVPYWSKTEGDLRITQT